MNRGSKYWQENWENHIELLEDKITGPLYKTVLERPGTVDPKESFSWQDRWVHGPRKISVSKVNATVSLFITSVWFILMISVALKLGILYKWWNIKYLDIGMMIAFVIAAVFTVTVLLRKAGSHVGDHGPLAFQRKTYIHDNIK